MCKKVRLHMEINKCNVYIRMQKSSVTTVTKNTKVNNGLFFNKLVKPFYQPIPQQLETCIKEVSKRKKE